jgi:acylphosphatase
MTRERVTITVSGNVQGVAFRAYTARTATQLGLTGYVRNLGTAQVEIVAEGRRVSLEQLVEWAEHGPPTARVDSVEVAYSDATGEFVRFGVTE